MRSDLTDDERRFAARLLACRTSAALSRQKLANAAKLSEATIKFLENGRMKPSARTVLRLMNVPSLGPDLSPHFPRFRPLAQVPCSPITTLVR